MTTHVQAKNRQTVTGYAAFLPLHRSFRAKEIPQPYIYIYPRLILPDPYGLEDQGVLVKGRWDACLQLPIS